MLLLSLPIEDKSAHTHMVMGTGISAGKYYALIRIALFFYCFTVDNVPLLFSKTADKGKSGRNVDFVHDINESGMSDGEP